MKNVFGLLKAACETWSLRIGSAGKTDLDSGKRQICPRNDFAKRNHFSNDLVLPFFFGKIEEKQFALTDLAVK